MQSQAFKPREPQGDLKAEDNWSCADEASACIAEVSHVFCEPLEEQLWVDLQTQQQQTHKQKHDASAITDSFHSTGSPAFLMENTAFCGTGLDFQPAMQQRRRAAQPGTYLLGILVTVVDEVAADFVYGPRGSFSRPGGVITISVIDQLDSANLLSVSCKERWLTFLQPWHAAGWDATSLSDFADTLRPLQYRNDLDEDFIRSVSRSYLQKYIADLFTKQGFAIVGRSDVEDFLDIVHCLYSQRDAVLLPAKDAVTKCCKQTSD